MNRIVQRGDENRRLLGLAQVLPAAVALSACAVTTQVPLSGTSTSPTATAPVEMRPLSQAEKTALAKTLAQAVTKTRDAQFKWLPVAANGTGPIGYCGLVNVKSNR